MRKIEYIYEYLEEDCKNPVNVKGINCIHENRFYINDAGEKKKGEEILKDNLGGYKLGKLYCYRNNKKEITQIDFSVDFNTCNFHLYPVEGICEDLDRKIQDLHKTLLHTIEDQLQQNGVAFSRIINGKGIRQTALSKYIGVIPVNDKYCRYWLCYEKLLNNNGVINSVAGAIQFIYTKNNNLINYRDKNNDEIVVTYPKEDGSNDNYKTLYMNTDFSIESQPEQILSKFVEFIKDNPYKADIK